MWANIKKVRTRLVTEKRTYSRSSEMQSVHKAIYPEIKESEVHKSVEKGLNGPAIFPLTERFGKVRVEGPADKTVTEKITGLTSL